MSDRIHAREIIGHEGKITELATELGRLTYDQVSVFIGALATELARQAEGDRGRDRRRLATNLESLVAALLEAQTHADDAWRICLPYMKSEEVDEER